MSEKTVHMTKEQFARWMTLMRFNTKDVCKALDYKPRQIQCFVSGAKQIPRTVRLSCSYLYLRRISKTQTR